ncbi:MAG: LysM peptidoglycan-binding domain-containing protein [Firmicutes bacterium]|nr:LysM peptidoglycan-binding domain-containing protein [Bacillota bacterium]
MRTENNTQSRNPQIRTRKKYRIKSKFRFITSMIIMIGLLVGGISLITGMNKSFALTQPQFTEVEVCYGDTLWDIANTYKSDDTDTRRAVYEICKANDIEASDLEPGMVIRVPEKL